MVGNFTACFSFLKQKQQEFSHQHNNQSSASVFILLAVVSAFLHEEGERSRKILPEKI